MSLATNLPANRAVLFANLGQALNNGEKFPELFETSANISPVCFSGGLIALASKIRAQSDQPLLSHITETNLFMPWEVRFIRFGLATLKISEVFARLCDYYILVGNVTKRLLQWAGALWLLLSSALGYLVFGGISSSLSGGWSAIFGLLVAGSFLFSGWLLAPLMLKSWIEPGSALWMLVARIPLFRSLMITRSVYQYLLNLGLCIQGGFDLDRSLKITANTEPVVWLRLRYQGVAVDVSEGMQISRAFLSSGILTETKILASESGASVNGALWEPGITDIVRQSFARQLTNAAQLVFAVLVILVVLAWLSIFILFL